jgi:hypothetical protein
LQGAELILTPTVLGWPMISLRALILAGLGVPRSTAGDLIGERAA